MNKVNNCSISIILPFLNEIDSLNKTIRILEKIEYRKEYLVIFSKKLTNQKNKISVI